MSFKDKVVIVTGSSSGIGQQTAIHFAQEGANVVINYKTNRQGAQDTLDRIMSIGASAIIIQADLSIESEAKSLIEQTYKNYGRIDILVNNAGRYIDGDEWNGSSEIWKETLEQNFLTVLNTSKYAAEVFIKQKSGVIVNVSSRYCVTGQIYEIAYAAAKAGIVNTTLAYAKLLAPFGRANSVSPGATETGYWLRAPQKELSSVLEKIPLRKLAETNDIAEAILFLASDKAKMITGQNIIIDGGFTLK